MFRLHQGVFRAARVILHAAPALPLTGTACVLTANSNGTSFMHCAGKPTNQTQKTDASSLWVSGSEDGSHELLACKYDTYGGVIIEPRSVPQAEENFRHQLAASVAKWSADGRSGVWLELSIGNAKLIPVATEEFGFEFHSAERDHVILKRWLPTDRPSTLPEGASHTIGIGAVVVDDATQKVLLVREISGPAARMKIWKLPTGLVEAGEELHDAAVREVKEETGIDAVFADVRAFRMAHLGNLAHKGKSNLFFIVRLRVKPGISNFPPQAKEGEIAEARWFTLEEWESLPFPEMGTLYYHLNRSALQAGPRYVASEQQLGLNRKGTNWIYYPEAGV